MKKTINTLLTTSLTAMIISTPHALAADTGALKAFHATYQVVSEGSISMKGESERVLSQNADNKWLLKSRASALFASIEESSLFSLNQNQITPHQYLYNRKVLGKTRKANLSFDWQTQTVTNDVNNKPWKMDIQPGVMDKLSYQLQLQSDVAAGKKKFSYNVADGGRLKNYNFAVKGKETINTPAGNFNAVRVERIYTEAKDRQTLIWFAPALDYQMVKLYRQEKKDKIFSLELKTSNQKTHKP